MTDLELLDVLEVLLDVDGGCSTCAKDAIADLMRKPGLELDRELVALALEVLAEGEAGRSSAKRIADWLRTAKLG